ncbi:MAG: hypothetical protein FWH32_01255 [Clostridiales bacterium]|nr:hypothetical protein [Clostridiales bacterium]
MAERICFISRPESFPIYEERAIEFEFFTGFALQQKQKSILSFHESIRKADASLNTLEVSTKSTIPLGAALSAFNLRFSTGDGQTYPLENIFQSSKVFEQGGPFRDLLNVEPKDARGDDRLKASGKLTHFEYGGQIWPLEPKSMFYDWIYIQALVAHTELADAVMEYNTFTDIEFNHKKSINCQARAAAIFVSLRKNDMLEKSLSDQRVFREIYKVHENPQQICMEGL